jgi:hypothetical protein
MLVSMLVASDDATPGSVMQNAERISPASSGFSQRSLLAGEAKRSRISMLPVSGAEQLKTSPDQPTRPITSHSGEYSRFVSPAPLAECGRNMFHRPAARAFGLSCSITGIGSQRALPSRLPTSSATAFSCG